MTFAEYVNRLEDALLVLWTEIPADRVSELPAGLFEFSNKHLPSGRPNLWLEEKELA